jgi:hypothetical protein
MKYYKKIYEDVFNKRNNLVDGNNWKLKEDLDKEEFFKLFSYFLKEESEKIFNFIITFEWFRRMISPPNGDDAEYAPRIRGRILSHVCKRYCNIDYTAFNQWTVVDSTTSYIDDFFPEFIKYNPIEYPEKCKWPYKNITISYLFPVYKIKDDRLDLLKKADEDNMGFYEYMDYLVNHVACKNEEEEGTKYTMIKNAMYNSPYYFNYDKPNKKYEQSKTSLLDKKTSNLRRKNSRKKNIT